MQSPFDVCFESYGVRFALHAFDPTYLQPLFPHLPPGWVRSSCSGVHHTYALTSQKAKDIVQYELSFDGSPLMQTPDVALVVDRFASDIHHRVAATTGQFLFVHAGVVGWQGKAILLPGRSFAGKSRLVETLVRAGAAYYSDEFALFDDGGMVHPYPKLLVQRGVPGEPRVWQSVADFGQVGTRPIPVGLIASLRYEPQQGWNVHYLTPGQGVLALFDNTVQAQRRPGDALRLFSGVASRTTILAGTRGEADEAAGRLQSILGDAPTLNARV